MSYHTVMTFLNEGNDLARVRDFSLDLALQFDAHLSAQYLDYLPMFAYDPYGQIAQFAAEWEAIAAQNRKSAKAAFEQAADKAGVKFDWAANHSIEWREAIPHARASDLIILGQYNPESAGSDLGLGFCESVVLRAGRPVLYVPYAGALPKQMERVLVAWDGGREAARAVADALPFLRRAKQVTVLTVLKESEPGKTLPEIDIGSYLARHSIKAELADYDHVEIDTGSWILSRAADENADMLVMGAYGHSRFGEIMLGGVTRTMLRDMTIPVLMSH